MNKHLVAVQSAHWYDNKNDDDKAMALAKECGIEAIDFNIDLVINTYEYVKGKQYPFCDKPIEEFVESFSAMKAAAEKYGIKFSQMHAPFPTWFEDMPEQTEYLLGVVEKCMAVCAYVDCPAIVVHPYNSGCKKKDVEINLDMYRRLMPAAKRYGVKICLENLFSIGKSRLTEGICTHAEDACYLIDLLNEEAGEDVFGFCLDVGHANVMGKNLRQYINTLGKRLTVLHIHDNDGRGDKHMLPYTQATDLWGEHLATDWEGFLAGLRDIGYEGNICFETFRAVDQMPREVETEILKLITAIGRYFRSRIEE